MRILEFDELPKDAEPQAQLLDLSATWAPNDFARFSEARKIGYPSADYAGVYAVEKGEVLSAIRVLRLPYATQEGVKQIAGIQGVVTRRDSGRRGLARLLLQDVHKRVKGAGSSYSLLWTGRGQVAFSLFERMGYQDVYTPELATLHIGRRRDNPGRYTVKSIRNDRVDILEELHSRSMDGRLGFALRPRGVIRSLIHLGFLPAGSLHTIHLDGELVGYALLQRHSTWCSLDELVLGAKISLKEVLPTLEAAAPQGGWFVIRNTSVRDALPLLRRRGYHYSPLSYYGLLAMPLERSGGEIMDELGTRSPLFTCQQLDYF